MIDRSSWPSASSSVASIMDGRNSFWAMIVGTKAERITTVTSSEYCALLITPCCDVHGRQLPGGVLR